jgi:hypothetical protein
MVHLNRGARRLISPLMHLDLADEEAAALIKEHAATIAPAC